MTDPILMKALTFSRSNTHSLSQKRRGAEIALVGFGDLQPSTSSINPFSDQYLSDVLGQITSLGRNWTILLSLFPVRKG